MEMTTKHFVIFGAGVIAGYLLVDYLRKNPMGSTTPTQNIPPPAPPITEDKVANCQASLDEKLQSIKMMPENLEAYKKEFMDDCLKVEGTPCTKVVGGVVGIIPGVYKNGVCVNPNTQQGTGGYIDMGGGEGVYGNDYITCPEGEIPCDNQPVGGGYKCFDPNANYVMNPCA